MEWQRVLNRAQLGKNICPADGMAGMACFKLLISLARLAKSRFDKDLMRNMPRNGRWTNHTGSFKHHNLGFNSTSIPAHHYHVQLVGVFACSFSTLKMEWCDCWFSMINHIHGVGPSSTGIKERFSWTVQHFPAITLQWWSKKIGYTGMPQLQCFKIPVSAFKLPCARAITIMGSSNFEKIQTWWTLQKKTARICMSM